MRDLLEAQVGSGALPGAVALLARGDRVEVTAVGSVDVEGTAPMRRDTIFRIASITKPITAAALLTLVQDGAVGLDDPVDRWLPELAHPHVVRTPASALDDVVPAERAITVFDLLSGQAGYGWPSDFTVPAVRALFAVQKDGREPQTFAPVDEWMADLARIPLLYQPGRSWLYDTCSALQGVLIARAAGRPLPEVLAERVLAPLGMVDTAFTVPAAKRDRFTATTAPRTAARWSWPTPPTGNGVRQRRSRSGRAGSPVPPTTGWRSARCCWPAVPPPTGPAC